MNLWRLEWLRLTRTHRLLAIVAVEVFFGLTGPLTARYVSEIVNGLGTNGVRVEFPAPRPADGIEQYTGNAAQIGLLVVVMVAGSALAFDARREMAVFLRTRVPSVRSVIVPAYAVNAGAAAVAFTAGALAAWYETAVLLGPLPAGRMALGIALGALFLVFAVALTALAAALARSALAASGIALGVLLGMAVLGGLGQLGRWLPTSLATAMAGLVRDTPPSHYVPAAGVAALLTAVAVTGATVLSARREL